MEYKPEYSISEEEFLNSLLFEFASSIDDFQGDDCIQGAICNTPLLISEVHAFEGMSKVNGYKTFGASIFEVKVYL